MICLQYIPYLTGCVMDGEVDGGRGVGGGPSQGNIHHHPIQAFTVVLLCCLCCPRRPPNTDTNRHFNVLIHVLYKTSGLVKNSVRYDDIY